MPTTQLQYRSNATNKRKILDLIRNSSGISSKELSSLTGLTQPEIIHFITLLCNRKRIIREVESKQKTYFIYKPNQEIKRWQQS